LRKGQQQKWVDLLLVGNYVRLAHKRCNYSVLVLYSSFPARVFILSRKEYYEKGE